MIARHRLAAVALAALAGAVASLVPAAASAEEITVVSFGGACSIEV